MDDVDLFTASYSIHHMDCEVMMEDGEPWLFTWFYGHPDSDKKNALLEFMENIILT